MTWLGRILTRYQTTVFGLNQIESNCRRQNKCWSNYDFYLDGVENNVGKGENVGYQHFLLFPQCFQKFSLFRVVKKSGLCGNELTEEYVQWSACRGSHYCALPDPITYCQGR